MQVSIDFIYLVSLRRHMLDEKKDKTHTKKHRTDDT